MRRRPSQAIVRYATPRATRTAERISSYRIPKGGALSNSDADVLVHRPRLVVVELGVNDEVDHRRPAEETLATLERITRRLRKNGAAVVVVDTPFGDFDREVYRQGFRDIARRQRVRLVEHFYHGIVPSLTVDGLHPSAEGHALLAQRLGRGSTRDPQRRWRRFWYRGA